MNHAKKKWNVPEKFGKPLYVKGISGEGVCGVARGWRSVLGEIYKEEMKCLFSTASELPMDSFEPIIDKGTSAAHIDIWIRQNLEVCTPILP